MSAVITIILIIVVAVIAFFVGRWHGLATGTKELTTELESKDKELNELKSGVNEHFDETARLFSNLTEEYKAFYQHLSKGANKLAGNDLKLKLSAPVGADALSSDTKTADVIDAEEHLAKDTIKRSEDDPEQAHEEESFVSEDSPKVDSESEGEPLNKSGTTTQDATDADTKKQSLASDQDSTKEDITESPEPVKPDLDIEVSPPRDWADDDMDDDYHPNDPRASMSEFSDLSKEESEKLKAPGYEPKDDKKGKKAPGKAEEAS